MKNINGLNMKNTHSPITFTCLYTSNIPVTLVYRYTYLLGIISHKQNIYSNCLPTLHKFIKGKAQAKSTLKTGPPACC